MELVNNLYIEQDLLQPFMSNFLSTKVDHELANIHDLLLTQILTKTILFHDMLHKIDPKLLEILVHLMVIYFLIRLVIPTHNLHHHINNLIEYFTNFILPIFEAVLHHFNQQIKQIVHSYYLLQTSKIILALYRHHILVLIRPVPNILFIVLLILPRLEIVLYGLESLLDIVLRLFLFIIVLQTLQIWIDPLKINIRLLLLDFIDI